MIEDTNMPQIDDTSSADDLDVLRSVLEDEHSRGISAVSVYDTTTLFPETE